MFAKIRNLFKTEKETEVHDITPKTEEKPTPIYNEAPEPAIEPEKPARKPRQKKEPATTSVTKKKATAKKKSAIKAEEPIMTAKELATKNGEPYVTVVHMDIDPENVNNGAFELDWNEKFIVNLIRAGYQLKPTEPEDVIVDRWFTTLCRNIALEMYQQRQADPEKREGDMISDIKKDLRRVNAVDIGGGRSEIG